MAFRFYSMIKPRSGHSVEFKDALLDDPAALTAGDPQSMLEAIASSGAQVRRGLLWGVDNQELLSAIEREGRPRAVIICGMGGSAVAGDVVCALASGFAPVPVSTFRGYGLPAWVGPLDVVITISCSGETEETLLAFDEANRRGARVIAVGSDGSSLAKRATQASAVFVAVDPGGRAPRANLWALTVPLILIAKALKVVNVTTAQLEQAADVLDQECVTSGPSALFDENPGKNFAYFLAGTLPLVWGTSALTGVAASRCAAQLAENADYPCIHGELSEPNHNQVVMLDGPFAAMSNDADLFADPSDGGPSNVKLSLVLLRDVIENPQITKRAKACVDLATERGVFVHEISLADGTRSDSFIAFAQVVVRLDFATTYLALGLGINPSDIAPITSLKDRIAP